MLWTSQQVSVQRSWSPIGGMGEPLAEGGRGSACRGLPIPAPGPHAHFLGILVGFPQALESGPHSTSPLVSQGAEHTPKTWISMANRTTNGQGPESYHSCLRGEGRGQEGLWS